MHLIRPPHPPKWQELEGLNVDTIHQLERLTGPVKVAKPRKSKKSILDPKQLNRKVLPTLGLCLPY